MNPGMAKMMHRRIIGGSCVTAKVAPAIKAVPRMPTTKAYADATEVFDFSSTSISFAQASKWR